MLVLSRETLESIVLTVPPSDQPRTIKVTVLDIRRCGRTRLGFQSEPEVVIDREEVWKRKEQGTTEPEGTTDEPTGKIDGAAEDPLATAPGAVAGLPVMRALPPADPGGARQG